jgi:hypothetical protein
MRVSLPSSPAPPPPTAPLPPESAVQPADAQSRLTKTQRFLAFATSWTVALPVLLLSAGAFYWSLVIRLPASQQSLKVQARNTPSAVHTNRAVTMEELLALRKEADARSALLIRHRKEIPSLLTTLDARARDLGWRCETSLRPAVPAPGGVRELTMHPVLMDLHYESGQPDQAYAGFLAWMWTVSTLRRRAEVSAVQLQSLGRGLNRAQVELNFFSLNGNEENPAK